MALSSRVSFAVIAGAVATAAGVFSCASISGLGDLDFDLGAGGGGSTATSSSRASSGVSASSTTSSSASSSSVASGSGGATASSSSSGMPVEDCTNGLDDDGNKLVDCADPACATYQCVGGIPAGWTGPVALYDGLNQPPACPPDYPVPVYTGTTGLIAPPATCSPCMCMNPQVTCKAATIDGYLNAVCSGMPALPGFFQTGNCDNFGVQYASSVISQPPTPMVGACSASGANPNIPPVSWATQGLACAPANVGAGCNPGKNPCLPPKPGNPFQPAYCIFQAGDNSCPAAFKNKILYDDKGAVTDTRGCDTCTCNGMGSCTASTDLYSDTMCTMKLVTVQDDGMCHDTAGGGGANSFRVTTVPSASCASTGGQPHGNASAAGPFTTFCCD